MENRLTDREKQIFLMEYLGHPSAEHYTLVRGLAGESLNRVYYPLALLDELGMLHDEEGGRHFSCATVVLLSIVAQRLTEILALEVSLLRDDGNSTPLQ